MGLLQPFADAIKLFTKEHCSPFLSNYLVFLLAPIGRLFLSLLAWLRLPRAFNLIRFDYRIIFFLCVIGLGVYSLMGAGWSSNSKYSLLGALRGVAQTISYEVSLVLILLVPIMVGGVFGWLGVMEYQGVWFITIFPLSGLIWLISGLAETNRTPFDFAEGERELVSGYNTEYSAGGFALLVIAEYGRILFMSFTMVMFFIWRESMWINYIIFLGVSFVYVWVRGTLPRFRYDKLIRLAWKVILPYALIRLILISLILGVI